MTHTRIRACNTKDTYPEQKLDNDGSVSVRAKAEFIAPRLIEMAQSDKSILWRTM